MSYLFHHAAIVLPSPTVQEAKGIACMELPLIEHRHGPDLQQLEDLLRGVRTQWVAALVASVVAREYLRGGRDVEFSNVWPVVCPCVC